FNQLTFNTASERSEESLRSRQKILLRCAPQNESFEAKPTNGVGDSSWFDDSQEELGLISIMPIA
ncbi:MAG: hypothetical protein BZY75_04005, partial [SAR202 cluster bacterium Io17-Chloro-G7]